MGEELKNAAVDPGLSPSVLAFIKSWLENRERFVEPQ